MGSDGPLVPAHALIGLPGEICAPTTMGLGWPHTASPDHAVVFAESARAESLYLGREVPKALSSQALEELAAIFSTRKSAAPPRGCTHF